MHILLNVPSPVFCFVNNTEFEINKLKNDIIIKSNNKEISKIFFFKLLSKFYFCVKWQLFCNNYRNHFAPTNLLLTQNKLLDLKPKFNSDNTINIFSLNIKLNDIHKYDVSNQLILNKNFIFIQPFLEQSKHNNKPKSIKTDTKSILIEIYNSLSKDKQRKVLQRIKKYYRGTKRKR